MLFLEYSQKVINQLIDKFTKEAPDQQPEVIADYITRFDQIKGLARVEEKDIFKYTWNQLEQLVDALAPSKSIVAKSNAPTDPIGTHGNVQIFYADGQTSCTLIKNHLDELACRKHGWCIASTQWSNYRRRRSGQSLYLFYNPDATEDPNTEDRWITGVIQKVIGEDNYLVTSSRNADDTYMTWSEIERKIPQLRGARNIFLDKEFTDKETIEAMLAGKELTPDEFLALPHNQRVVYMGMKDISLDMWLRLPNNKERNVYLNAVHARHVEGAGHNTGRAFWNWTTDDRYRHDVPDESEIKRASDRVYEAGRGLWKRFKAVWNRSMQNRLMQNQESRLITGDSPENFGTVLLDSNRSRTDGDNYGTYRAVNGQIHITALPLNGMTVMSREEIQQEMAENPKFKEVIDLYTGAYQRVVDLLEIDDKIKELYMIVNPRGPMVSR